MQALRQHYDRHCRQPDLTLEMWLERMLLHWTRLAETETTMAAACGPGEHLVLVRVTREIARRYWESPAPRPALSDWITQALEERS
jgi:hypothetical protein